jgi:hypothetical protein
MPNILIHPNSGILEFNTGTTGSSSLDASMSGAARLTFTNSGTLGLTSYSTGVVDKFFVEGVNGRLFEVDDVMTGSLMSVNDIAGLPIFEVFSDDTVVMGQYNQNTLVVSGTLINISGKTTIAASSTGRANLNLPHGLPPTSPVNGDIWTTNSGIYAQISGSTIGPFGPQYYLVSGFTGTALTLALGHASDYIRTTSATAVTITVPPTSVVNWVNNTEILFEQAGAGQITFATGTGVVINTSETLKTQKQYSVAALKMVSGNVWTLLGERELL